MATSALALEAERRRTLAILLQPEVFNMLQIIRKHGSSARFFSDGSLLTEVAQSFANLRRRLRQPPSRERSHCRPHPAGRRIVSGSWLILSPCVQMWWMNLAGLS